MTIQHTEGAASNPHSVTPAQLGNDTAQWNANQIQGIDAPTPAGLADDQKVLTYDDTSGDYLLVTPPGAGGGETNDLVLNAGATGETIRVTKTGSDIFIKGILGTGTITTTTNGSDIEINLPASNEGIVGALAIANSADMTSETDDTKAVTPKKLADKLNAEFLKIIAVSKSTSGAYTLLSGDVGTNIYIDNTLTIPVLTADFQVTVRNDSASAVGLTLTGTTAKNTNDTQISAFGTITILYQSTTDVWIDGNTEA